MKHPSILISTLVLGLVATASASALTVQPARIELSGDPGNTVIAEISLLNEEKTAKVFYSSFDNFESNGQTGAPHFTGSNGDLATWIQTDAQVALTPGETKAVPFSIAIPSNAEPGGHFAALFWSTSPPSSQNAGQLAVGGKVGILVLLTVTGDVKEGGGILGFHATQRFFAALPVDFVYQFANGGGDRVKPSGVITVRNAFGRTSAVLSANEQQGNILPRSTRTFEVSWGTSTGGERTGFFAKVEREWQEFHFGWYKATLGLTFGRDSQAVSAIYTFFIVPWQLLLVILVILVILGAVGRLGIRRYNRWIVAKVTGYVNK